LKSIVHLFCTIKRKEAAMFDFLCPKCDGNIRAGDHVISGVHSTFTTDGDSVHVAGEDTGK
jgi:hypothetical protein